MTIDEATLLRGAAWAGAHALPLYAGLLTALLSATGVIGRVLLRHRDGDTATPVDLSPAMLVIRYVMGFGLILACGALFAEIAEEVHAERTLGLMDEAFIVAMVDTVPDIALRAFYALTFLGNRETLIGLALLVAVGLWVRRRRGLALGWSLAMIGNGLLNPALKHIFERARPVHPTQWLTETGFSFPSGHSSGSVIAYGMLAYLAVRLLPARWHLPAWLAAVAVAFSIGVSRIFLRVHFPSDVLAGFASGTAWLAVCVVSIELARWVRKRRHPADR
ncbi:MAG: phosphatase PAP2 family protein [Burkholderiaceae bacterium]